MQEPAVVDVIVVGAGLLGTRTACRLASEGLSVTVLDKQHDLGGVWQGTANASSRVQAPEPYYRIGDEPAEEDWTTRANVLAEMRKSASKAGILDRFLYGREAVKVHDDDGVPYLRLLHRAAGSTGEQPLEELRAGNVIFCCGGLQRPRDLPLQGEASFGGTVLTGIAGQVDQLDYRGKRVLIIGMGAFGIENMRTALFAGASHVDIVTRTPNHILPRSLCGLGAAGDDYFGRDCDRPKGSSAPINAPRRPPKDGPDPADVFWQKLYGFAGAQDACPKGFKLNGTVPSASDPFFIAGYLGKMKVHVGQVDHLERGAAILQGGSKLEADIIIKNPGFHEPDREDLLGGICEVAGHQTYRPPIWITPRVLLFRCEHPGVKKSEIKRLGELYAYPASGPFLQEVWCSLYLFFRKHPDKLAELLANDAVPEARISEGSLLDAAVGLHAALSMDETLRTKVQGMKREIRKAFETRYAPKGTPKAMLGMAWLAAYMQDNIAYWEECCEKIAGDRYAVPYMGTAIMQSVMGGANKEKKNSKRPVGQAAL